MSANRATLSAQIAALTELVNQTQQEVKRIAETQERILESIGPPKPPLKFVIVSPPICFEFPDAYLKVFPREWEAIKSGRPVCVIGEGYRFEGELDGQDYWFFRGGIKRGTLHVLIKMLCNSSPNNDWDTSEWEEVFDGPVREVIIEEFDENEALGIRP